MPNSPFSRLYNLYQIWLSKLRHRERIILLIIGWLFIYTLWYVFLYRPASADKIKTQQEIKNLAHEIQIYKSSTETILREGKQRIAQTSTRAPIDAKIGVTSKGQESLVLKAILRPEPTMSLLSFKKLPPNESAEKIHTPVGLIHNEDLEIVFKSDFFATLAYLNRLEKLPWCLSWNSIEYKVTTYPQAVVTLHLTIVSL